MASAYSDDEEITLQLPKLKYEEVTGKRGGTLYQTEDNHLFFSYILYHFKYQNIWITNIVEWILPSLRIGNSNLNYGRMAL